MPKVSNPRLVLDRTGAKVIVSFIHHAVFSEFERHLAGLGLVFQERLELIGVDPPGSTTGSVFFSTLRSIPVTDGVGELSLRREFSLPFNRTSLDEDPSAPFLGPDFDVDEYRGRIQILAIGLPPAATPGAFTPEARLGEGVFQTAVNA
jgi:hypothetical protein